MQLIVNGEPRHFPLLSEAPTLAALLTALGYAGKRIAVEQNGEIVPRSRHASAALADGDRIEIVVAVGGG
jgi:sulfur carrier protein